jgi:hypothetical protein
VAAADDDDIEASHVTLFAVARFDQQLVGNVGTRSAKVKASASLFHVKQ